MSRRRLVIPERLTVTDHKGRVQQWEVLTGPRPRWAAPLEDEVNQDSGKALAGATDPACHQVWLGPHHRSPGEDPRGVVLLHEILHVAAHASGLPNAGDAHERFIERIDAPLFELVAQLRFRR